MSDQKHQNMVVIQVHYFFAYFVLLNWTLTGHNGRFIATKEKGYQEMRDYRCKLIGIQPRTMFVTSPPLRRLSISL